MKTLVLILSALLPWMAIAQNPSLPELDEAGFRRIAKERIAFVNFNNPSCDLGQYYNNDIAVVNERLPKIPIYYFDLTKYPQIKKEFKLYGLDRLTALTFGEKEEKYEGFISYNILEEWLVKKTNQYKNTTLPIKKYRSKSYASSPSGIDIESHLKAHYLFDGNGDNERGEGAFKVVNNGKKVFEYKNNTLYSSGEYLDSDATTGYISLSNKGKFTIYCEFFPLSSKFANLLCVDRSNRYFAIELIDGKLAIALENGNWRYIAHETRIKKGDWNALAVSLDYDNRHLEVVLNGQKLDNFILDKDIAIKNGSPTFSPINYSNGNVYHGFYNQLKVYDEAIKGGDLTLLYNREKRNYPDVSTALPSDKVAQYDFSSLQNKVSNSNFTTPDGVKAIQNNKLYVNPKEGDYTKCQTETFRFSNDQFTVALDFELEEYAYENKSYGIAPMAWFFSVNDGRKDYISTKIVERELVLKVGEYPGVEVKSKGAGIQLNKTHNLILSFNKNSRLLQVLLDGKAIINEYIAETVVFNPTEERLIVGMFYGSPYRFRGYLDNLQIYSKSYSASKLKELYQYKEIKE